MKKILLLCFVLMMYKSYSQQVTLEFTEAGILKKFNSKVAVPEVKALGIRLAKPSYPLSLNKDFPSVLLDTNQKVSFVIKQPVDKSIIPNKLERLKKNLNDTNFTKNLVFKSIFPNNCDTKIFNSEIPSFIPVNNKVLVYNDKEKLNFPFVESSDVSIFNLYDKDRKIIKGWTGKANESYDINTVTSFKIEKQNFDNQIIIKHLAYLKTKKETSYNNDWEQFRPVLDEIAQKYETWGKEIDKELFFNGRKFNIKTVLYLDSLSSYSKNFNTLFDKVIYDNKGWIKAWLWYTEGEIKLNPFIVTDPSPQISIVDEEISLAEDKIKLLNSYAASDRQINEEFKDLEKDLGRLEAGLSILKHQKEDLAGLKTKYQTWINTYSQQDVILYNGVLPVSNKDKITWLQHYDAKNKFEYKNASNSLPHSIADIDELVTLVHNVQQGQTVEVKSTEKAINLEPPLAIELEPFLASFVKAFELIPNVGKVANILRPLLSGVKTQTILTNPSSEMLSISLKSGFIKFDKEISDQSFQLSSDKIKKISYKEIEETALRGNIRKADSLLRAKVGSQLLYGISMCFDFTNRSRVVDSFTSLHPSSLRFTKSKRESQKNKNIRLTKDSIYAIQEIILKNISKQTDISTYILLTNKILKCSSESDYQIAIKAYQESKIKLDWLLAQTTPITEIEANKEPLTLNSTKILYPEKDLNLTTTKLITSKGFLAGEEKPIFEKEVKKYERQRFWPMAGMAIIPKTREIAVYDAKTQQFKTDTPISTVEGFVGVKWFVFGKTNIDYTYKSTKLTQLGQGFNRKRGNSLINRCALNIALGVSHQFMKNYLVGISIDPVPGIGINVGTNFFLQKGYLLENGVVLNEYERFSKPYFYYGINIDPTIFSKIAKLF